MRTINQIEFDIKFNIFKYGWLFVYTMALEYSFASVMKVDGPYTVLMCPCLPFYFLFHNSLCKLILASNAILLVPTDSLL